MVFYPPLQSNLIQQIRRYAAEGPSMLIQLSGSMEMSSKETNADVVTKLLVRWNSEFHRNNQPAPNMSVCYQYWVIIYQLET